MNPAAIDSDNVVVYHGESLEVMAAMPDNSVDTIVTDPPYGLEFMGKEWDRFAGGARTTPGTGGTQAPFAAHAVPLSPTRNAAFGAWCEQWAREACRVLKPGGHMLAFGGTRTWHRLTTAIEDAGFEIRDSITWLYGSGFPKSLDVSKAIDKAVGAQREVIGPSTSHVSGKPEQRTAGLNGSSTFAESVGMGAVVTAPATDDARRWQGWGTALKPASEPIVVARKPLSGTVAATVLAHGTGALNIDGCRVGADVDTRRSKGRNPSKSSAFPHSDDASVPRLTHAGTESGGRWPANVVLTHAATADGADLCGDGCVPGCPVAELDAQSGVRPSGSPVKGTEPSHTGATGIYGTYGRVGFAGHGDSGGASRFFPTFRYQAKAPSRERPRVDGVAHPTVKPLALMRWLVRLVCPAGGIVLDPFAGSGTTLEAAILENFNAVGVERDGSYLPLITARLDRVGVLDLTQEDA